MFPFKEDLFRFDFEVAPEDEYMCEGITSAMLGMKGCKEDPRVGEGVHK